MTKTPCGAESCPAPSASEKVPPDVYFRTTPADDVTQTLPDASIAIPVAPVEAQVVPATPTVV